MTALDIKKHQIEQATDQQAIIDSPRLADMVRNDKDGVVQHISEVVGPIDPSDISVDPSGKVIVKNNLFAAAARSAKISPLDNNLICNHHLICT
jgi:hypothetical protein